MSRHDPLVRLRHMLDFACDAVALMQGRSLEEFSSNHMLVLAEARLVELVGEAANHVSRDIQEALPDVPWTNVVGMRHRLIHGYDMISTGAIHSTVVDSLPMLIRQLRGFLDDAGRE